MRLSDISRKFLSYDDWNHVLFRVMNFTFQMMLNENSRVRAKIPTVFELLIVPHISKVERAIAPGLNKLSWTSMNLDEYVQTVYDKLEDLELLLIRANDLVEFRIDTVLKDMATTSLCQLPEEEPLTMKEFSDKTLVSFNCLSVFLIVNQKYVIEILKLLLQSKRKMSDVSLSLRDN